MSEQGQTPVDAGKSIEEMAQAQTRAALSDFETQLQDMLKQAEAGFAGQFKSYQDQIGTLQRQLESVRMQAGPPDAVRLAAALQERVSSIAAAHPALGPQHFAGVASQAASLNDAVQAVANGQTTDTAPAERTANGIITWFERRHPRLSNTVLEMGGAAVDEAERIIEELPKLVSGAAAIAKAV